MKKIISPILFIALTGALAACNTDCIKGTGKQAEESRSLKGFSNISVSGTMKLVVQQDSTASSAKIVADDNILKYIKTDVSGDKLEIKLKSGAYCNLGPITVYLKSKKYTGLETTGDVNINSEGRINTDNIDLKMAGTTKAVLDISASKVNTIISGTAELHLKGQSGEHNVDMSGACDMDALDFVVGKYNIKTAGTSKLQINVLNDLNVSTTGAGEVLYKGNPKNITQQKAGAANVKKID